VDGGRRKGRKWKGKDERGSRKAERERRWRKTEEGRGSGERKREYRKVGRGRGKERKRKKSEKERWRRESWR
jgi:hypothetical protein